MLINDPDHFGAHGFVRHHHGEADTQSINVEEVDRTIEALVEKGFAARSGDAFDVDLGKAGFAKLLGGGRAARPLRITVPRATEAAKGKVQAAGGTVTTTEKDE